MTSFDIPRQRLRSQRLTGPILENPGEAVEWLVAVQAQDFAGAKWALGMRLGDAPEEEVDRAFVEGAILRTHLLRPTWHFVTPDDIRWLLALTAPRVHAVNAHMYRRLELDSATIERSNSALAKALQGGHSLTRDELRGVLRGAGVETEGELRMGYLMMRAELDGIVCSGPRRGKQFTYTLLDERAPHARTLEREEALAELTHRFFRSRGPATAQDFAKWSGLTVADAASGLEAAGGVLRREEVDGRTFWFSPSEPAPKEATPRVHLLSIYDEFVSGYKDRSDVITEDYGARLWDMGNALRFIIVIDGRIVGTWRRTIRKGVLIVETQPFRQLEDAENRALVMEARRYGEFLGLSVELPGAEPGAD